MIFKLLISIIITDPYRRQHEPNPRSNCLRRHRYRYRRDSLILPKPHRCQLGGCIWQKRLSCCGKHLAEYAYPESLIYEHLNNHANGSKEAAQKYTFSTAVGVYYEVGGKSEDYEETLVN